MASMAMGRRVRMVLLGWRVFILLLLLLDLDFMI